MPCEQSRWWFTRFRIISSVTSQPCYCICLFLYSFYLTNCTTSAQKTVCRNSAASPKLSRVANSFLTQAGPIGITRPCITYVQYRERYHEYCRAILNTIKDTQYNGDMVSIMALEGRYSNDFSHGTEHPSVHITSSMCIMIYFTVLSISWYLR